MVVVLGAIPAVGADSAVLEVVTLAEAAQTATGDRAEKDQILEQKISNLADRLKSALGPRLVSIILYGSAAMDDWHERRSDINILCVLDQLSARELDAAEPVFRWWRQQGNPPPLLLSREEIRASTEFFPIEFHDMQEHRRVLYGTDVIRELQINHSFYRAQVEHELRAKRIRLRQKAAELLSRPQQLMNLLIDSISTFCVLGRHALILSGHAAHWKKQEIVAALERALNTEFRGANAILAARAAGKRRPELDAAVVFERYLTEMDELVQFVGRLNR